MEAKLALGDQAVLDLPTNTNDEEAGGFSEPVAIGPQPIEGHQECSSETICGPEQLDEKPQLEDGMELLEQRQQEGEDEKVDNGGEVSAEGEY